MPRLLTGTPAVYPHLVNLTRKLMFAIKDSQNKAKNIILVLPSFPTKFETNRSRVHELWSDTQTYRQAEIEILHLKHTSCSWSRMYQNNSQASGWMLHSKPIHLFIYSLFIYSFIHLFIYSFIHLFIIHLFIYSFIHLFIYSFIHLCILLFIHYSFIHLFIYS